MCAGAEAGWLLPWGPGWSKRSTSISDRFFLGGVGSLRGFRTRSVGPVDARRAPNTDAAPPSPPANVRSVRSQINYAHLTVCFVTSDEGCSTPVMLMSRYLQAHISQAARALADVGPADGPPLLHDFLGGDVLASVMASVSFDLPLEALRVSGFRGHVRSVSLLQHAS